MEREIRRVPANWQHPKHERYDYQSGAYKEVHKPLFENYEKRLEEFEKDIAEKGLKEAIDLHGGGPRSEDYAQFEGAPCDWWQVYETVSEGTPVSPAFATPEELIEHLVANGDDWDQQRGNGGWSRKAAEAFVNEAGWAPSFISTPQTGLISGVEALGK